MKTNYRFQELVAITRKIMAAFDRVERRPWTIETSMIELMKQVGDLAKRVLVIEKYYLPNRDLRPDYETSVEQIGDELADILYCLIRVAEHYQIDLETAHIRARRNEMRYLGEEPDF